MSAENVIERLRKALEPFVAVHSVNFDDAKYADTDAIYGRIITTEPEKNRSLTAGDLRRAISALRASASVEDGTPQEVRK